MLCKERTKYTVTASEARANFSKLGEEIALTGKTVTVFKNSKPWLVMAPAQKNRKAETLSSEEMKAKALKIAMSVEEEYYDVFEAPSKQ